MRSQCLLNARPLAQQRHTRFNVGIERGAAVVVLFDNGEPKVSGSTTDGFIRDRDMVFVLNPIFITVVHLLFAEIYRHACAAHMGANLRHNVVFDFLKITSQFLMFFTCKSHIHFSFLKKAFRRKVGSRYDSRPHPSLALQKFCGEIRWLRTAGRCHPHRSAHRSRWERAGRRSCSADPAAEAWGRADPAEA